MSEFQKAAAAVAKGAVKLADADKLELYANFKQATAGDINTQRPGVLDMAGKAKWDAWGKKKGESKESAEKAYVAKAKAVGVSW